MSSEFRFAESPDTAVFVCQRVHDGSPILRVTHDDDGDWQFLCGGDHSDGSGDKGLIACLHCLVQKDPSLNEVAHMCRLHSAERSGPEERWFIHDNMEDIVQDNVRQYGWHCMKVSGDEEGPGFVYTIGLYETFGHPEIICVGLPLDVAHQALCECARYIESGGRLVNGTEFWGALEDARCAFRTVLDDHYRGYLGYARWYYDEQPVPVVQMVWPDSKGRMPDDEGCAESAIRAQTPLWRE